MSIDEKFIQEYQCLIGCDEVGRGPIAGPVNGCSVRITQNNKNLLNELQLLGVTDSKKLTQKKRLAILEKLNIEVSNIEINKKYNVKFNENEFSFVVCERSPEEIDKINILQASLACMQSSSNELVLDNTKVLVDGNKIFDSLGESVEAIVKGDSKSTVIGLASIIAKEYRDLLMESYDKKFPGYFLKKNAGYPTKDHKQAVVDLGVTPIHRKSFKGVKEYLVE